MTQPNRRPRATIQVQDQLRQDILSGHFQPGDRLTAASLSERYGTSAMPIRAALRILEGQGLVVSTPHQGARVRPVDPTYVNELYELRCALVALMLPKCVAFITNNDLDRLQTLQTEIETAAQRSDFAAAMQLNAAFHASIYALGQNAQAFEVLEKTWLVLDALRARFGFGPDRLRESNEGHRRLLSALRRRDEGEAVTIALDYAERARRDLVQCIGAEATPAGSKSA